MKRFTKAMVIGILAIPFLSIFPQKNPSIVVPRHYCHVYLQLENKDRHCYGNVHAECGDEQWHTPPWGNWGVDSNLGYRWDDHQFQGWFKKEPSARWYQWNSCTVYYKPWHPPTPCPWQGPFSYYNDEETPEGCWEQHTWGWEINVYAEKEIWYETDPYVG